MWLWEKSWHQTSANVSANNFSSRPCHCSKPPYLQPDRHHILFGQALANCPKLLSRIFKMRQQAGQLVWKCDLELTEREWQYIKNVFAHDRLRPLLQHGRRVLAPLPGTL